MAESSDPFRAKAWAEEPVAVSCGHSGLLGMRALGKVSKEEEDGCYGLNCVTPKFIH